MNYTTAEQTPPAATQTFIHKPQARPRHPLFHFLMLVIGVPAALLACIIMLPFRLFRLQKTDATSVQ